MKNLLTGNKLKERTLINQEKISIDTLKRKLKYDPSTGIFTRNCVMTGSSIGDICGTEKEDGYVLISIDRVLYRAHRLAWLYCYGRWPDGDIDHINRIRSDNRISNLREANRSENLCNSSRRSDNKTGIRGVSFNRKNKNYTVRIQKNGKILTRHGVSNIGTARDIAQMFAKELHGDFSSV